MVLIVGFLLGLAFRNVDIATTAQLLAGLGPACALALVPSLVALSVETWAWAMTFASFARMPALLPLLRVRIVTESMCTALPLGPLWSEAIKPHLLNKHCGIDLPTGLTGIAGRKYLLVLAQGFYLLLGCALGYQAIAGGFEALGGHRSLAFSAIIAGCVLVLAGELLALVLGGGNTANRVVQALRVIPLRRLQGALSGLSDRIASTDQHAVRFFRAPWPARMRLASFFLAAWLLEACETWVLLLLVGANIDFAQALGVETVVVLVRHVLFMLPAGLGAQELGYTVFLGALGVGVEHSAAFAVLKRAKELVWIVIGYGLFVRDESSKPSKLEVAFAGATANSRS